MFIFQLCIQDPLTIETLILKLWSEFVGGRHTQSCFGELLEYLLGLSRPFEELNADIDQCIDPKVCCFSLGPNAVATILTFRPRCVA